MKKKKRGNKVKVLKVTKEKLSSKIHERKCFHIKACIHEEHSEACIGCIRYRRRKG